MQAIITSSGDFSSMNVGKLPRWMNSILLRCISILSMSSFSCFTILSITSSIISQFSLLKGAVG